MSPDDFNSVSGLEERALGFALAARLAAYPDAQVLGELDAFSSALQTSPAALVPVRAALEAQGGLDALCSEYLSLFGSQKERVSLNETEYGRMRGMSKGNDLADICGFYRAFGLEVTQDGSRRDLPDHLAMELEFYAVLLARAATLADQGDREGTEIVLDARKKFLNDHLGRLAMVVAEHPAVGTHPLYGGVFAWAGALVGAECQALGVKPPPLDFFAKDAEPDQVSCGALPEMPSAGDDKAAWPRPV